MNQDIITGNNQIMDLVKLGGLKMSHNLSTFIIIIILFIFQSCDRITSPLTKISIRSLTPEEALLVSSDNKFGVKIFKKIVNSSGDSNIVISPLSISMALGMTLNGALEETRDAMEATLELEGLTQEQINQSYKSLIELLTQLDPQVVFQIANSIWYRQELTVKKNFADLNKNFFNALVKGLNFADPNSVNIINQWVSDNTNGKIDKIINQINRDDLMFLINTIYFYGNWTYQFDKAQTKDDQFKRPDGTLMNCKMMQQSGDFQYYQTEDFQAVDLPYGIGDFRMTILLPNPEKNINAIISDLNDESLNLLFNSFGKQEGSLELPKFKTEYKIELKTVLQALGMGIAFTDGANFSNIFEGIDNALISSVRHKTFIKVNEEGTEAAAVTVVTTMGTSIGVYMRVDRPFVFIIHDTHSNTILFIGKIVEPTWT